MPPPLADRIAQYALSLRYDDLPPAVVHEVKRRLIDSVGCALGALHAPPCDIARKVASTITASPGATLWGTNHRTSPDWAAFANGAMVRYLDFNDTYLSLEPAHPSDNIPAAFAAAEAAGASGRDLIAAIVIAYEIQCRLCDAASLRAIGWDHVTYGVFSTAAAAGRLWGLDEERLPHALGIAGVASAALRQTRAGELSHWKGCAFANAARHGLFAAMLAREGMTGPAPIFEGALGFEKLVSGPLPVHGPFATGGTPSPAGDCMILRTSIKRWPVEYHAQSAVEAALALRAQFGPVLPAIDTILIQSHDAAVDIIGSGPEKWRPTSRETADHSLPYIAAVALADGEVTARQFDPARFTDPALLALLSRVRVERHADLSALYPDAVANMVTIVLADGRRRTARVDHPTGHARNPMSDAAVEGKFHSLADGVVGPARANEIAHWIWGIDTKPTVAELPRLLADLR